MSVIVCAAMREPRSGKIICGVRHCDDIMRGWNIKPFTEQGFVDNLGEFHDRFEALKIASAAGQLIRKTPPNDRLFSEDLY